MIPITSQLITIPENKHLNTIIESIKDNNCLFIVGPRGMGKSLIIQAAHNSMCVNSEYDSFYFDIERIGPVDLYEHISQKIAQKTNLNYVYEKNIAKFLNESIKKKTVLFFDKFRVLKDFDFYYQFMNDCLKIHNEGKAYPESGCSKIVMIFNSSIIHTSQPNVHSLWDIAYRIVIKPLNIDAIDEIIGKSLNSEDLLLNHNHLVSEIYRVTSGHRLLSRNLTFFLIHKSSIQLLQKIDINIYIDHIWKILNHVEEEKIDLDDEICNHFMFIIQLIESSFQLTKILIKILYKKKMDRGSKIPFYDKLTITGILKKNTKGNYIFSNIIYKEFIKRLFKGRRAGYYCLFHSTDEELWRLSMEIFADPTNRNHNNKYLLASESSFEHIIRQLIQKMRKLSDPFQLIELFSLILIQVFQIAKWSIFIIGENNIQQKDKVFNIHQKKCQINEKEKKNILEYTKHIIAGRIFQVDWTEKWYAFPFSTERANDRLFVGYVKNVDQIIVKKLSVFVKETFFIYNFLQKEISDKVLKETATQFPEKLKFDETTQIREKMQAVWELSRKILEIYNIRPYIFHEVFPDGRVISSRNVDSNLSTILTINDYIVNIKKIMVNEGKSVFNLSSKRHFIGNKLDNNIFILLETIIPIRKLTQIQNSLISSFDIFYRLINDLSMMEVVHRTIIESENCVFAINNDHFFIFASKGFNEIFPTTIKNIKKIKCYDLLNKGNKCVDCPMDTKNNFQTHSSIIKSFPVDTDSESDKKVIMVCHYSPLKFRTGKDDAGIIVYLNDVTKSMLIMESITKMQSMSNLNDIEKQIMETLNTFGFSRIFEWKPQSDSKTFTKKFVSVNYLGKDLSKKKSSSFRKGEVYFEDKDEFQDTRYVTIWYRKNTPKNFLKHIKSLDNLFDETHTNQIIHGANTVSFSIRESKSVGAYDEKRKHPYLWVSFPIYWDNEIQYLFNMDNQSDVDKNQMLLNISNIQLLETFCMAASSIMENVWKRNRYFDQFHSMIAHSVNEPLQILQFAFPLLVNEKKSLEKRKHWAKISQYNLEQVQSLINSFVIIEKGNKIVKPTNVKLNELLKNQIAIFELVADIYSINLLVNIPKFDIHCQTDDRILKLILNNLLGNTFQYIKSNKSKQKEIRIDLQKKLDNCIISISDNGTGLPEIVKNYFRQPYYSGLPYPNTGFGIGFSREMANMLKGDVCRNEKHTSGTMLVIILPDYE